ncbi:unnamed protein product [Albugo candida]|uniref:DIX domain-containing protein n=2 Tax=Albugo candida TaxID=65357 RepID=A0A024GSQ0_9STRA|nr:unnamed protein product [Albugo candida]|eukprot:CCI49594.1 unnamed protein product [Albugo candida]
MEGMLNYFIPEDGDSSDHMNVVPLPAVDRLILKHIKEIFPLPGEFHYRFKTQFEGTYVWLDLTDGDDVVPSYNGNIVSKISRIRLVKTPMKQHVRESVKMPDLIETHIHDHTEAKQEEKQAKASTPKHFDNDLVGLLSDPIVPTSPISGASAKPPTPIQSSATAPVSDPFNLFDAATNPLVHPIQSSTNGASRNIPKPSVTSPIHNFSNQGPYSPMSKTSASATMQNAPVMRSPPGNMNISQMGQHMGMNSMPNSGPNIPGNNSFQGLQWQGMGGGSGQQQRKW